MNQSPTSFQGDEMKKTTLSDIMESLESDDLDQAESSIHEWFLEHGRRLQSQLVNNSSLNEEFEGLETVSDALQNVEGAQVGEADKVPVFTKSALPSHKGEERIGGKPVEVTGKSHSSHEMEKSPKVVEPKSSTQNSKSDPKPVKAQKGALLNKVDGSVNTRSPISGEKNKKERLPIGANWHHFVYLTLVWLKNTRF